MGLTKVNLRNRVRVLCGNPKASQPVELADASIESELDAALRLLDKYVPQWALYNLTSEDDEQTYSVATNVTQVLEVYWFGASSLEDVFGEGFDVLYGLPVFDTETGYYKWALDWLMKQQLRARYDWEFNSHEGKIYLVPEPEVDDKNVYYLGAKDWAWATVPAGREDVIVKWTMAQCLKMLGRARAKLSGIQRSGGLIDYGSLDSLIRDGQYEEKLALEALLAESKKWMVML